MTSTLEAARSPLKILNHLDLIVDHERIEKLLGLHRTTPEPFLSQNKATVLAHAHLTGQIRGVSAKAAINKIARVQCIENVATVHAVLQDYLQAAQVEFHPSDICNEACRGCTYGHDEAAHKPQAVCFPFDRLGDLAKLNPRAMTIVGGGEPLLYRDGKYRFAELMDRLRQLLPECKFGLITNGTLLPPGDWFRHFAWVRFSVDAATPETYARMRGRDLFHLVTRNLVTMLRDSKIPQVNVGFVFSRENIAEAAEAARFFYELVAVNCPQAIDRLNIEYRPLRKDSKDEGRADFPEAITGADIEASDRQFERLAVYSRKLAEFLGSHTNRDIIRRGNAHVPVGFQHCGFSSVFRLVRANGEMRPCCMRLFDPEFYLGNLLTDPAESIALNIIANANFLKRGCDATGCKLGQYNRLTEDGVAGLVAKSDNPAIAANPFFG